MAAPAMNPNGEPPELAVVVPTYEERDNLPTLVERIDAALGGRRYRIVVVDDDSPDGTADAARSLGERYPVDVIVRKEERGLASAVVEGIRRSASRYVAVIDADLQHPPELLPACWRRPRTPTSPSPAGTRRGAGWARGVCRGGVIRGGPRCWRTSSFRPRA